MSSSLAWDERYAGGGFQFGAQPNLFLRGQAYRLRPGMHALAVGDGEGRQRRLAGRPGGSRSPR